MFAFRSTLPPLTPRIERGSFPSLVHEARNVLLQKVSWLDSRRWIVARIALEIFRSGQVTSAAYGYPINPTDISAAAFSPQTRSFDRRRGQSSATRRGAGPAICQTRIVSLSRRGEGKKRRTTGFAMSSVTVDVVSGSASGFPKRRIVERNERALLQAM